MGSEGMTLAQALERIDELAEALEQEQDKIFNDYYDEGELQKAIAEALANPEQKTCRRCYGIFWTTDDSQQYCSRDCREFRRQEPFETLWKQLHPNGSGEPNRKFAATV